VKFSQPLVPGVLLRRYKRFLADVRLEDGRIVQAHCPNSGSMLQCAAPGWEVRLTEHPPSPRRKTRYTWQMVHNGRCWIGINTHLANRLAAEAVAAGRVPSLAGYALCRREVPYGLASRIDLLLERPTTASLPDRCFVEVKNVTLIGDDGAYCFPDAPTARGRKHLRELTLMVREGARSVMLFVIQRSDGRGFRPAAEIDPAYAAALTEAGTAGVEVLAWRADVTPGEIALRRPEPVLPPAHRTVRPRGGDQGFLTGIGTKAR